MRKEGLRGGVGAAARCNKLSIRRSTVAGWLSLLCIFLAMP